jgi:DUF1680 family protein
MFMASATNIMLDCESVKVIQKTNYPWEGRIEISVLTNRTKPFTFRVRIPGWALNQTVPSTLYTNMHEYPKPSMTLNGQSVALDAYKGYVQINRIWKPEDRLILEFPMPVRQVVSHPAVTANRNHVAFERGPLVYCFESLDNGPVADIKIGKNPLFHVTENNDLLGNIHSIDIETADRNRYTAIPYYARSNRDPCEMIVWVPAN